ncbi:MAG: YwmB family TATA-box binding protein [Senegalia sp. (in: firmicutes)]|uniref:YwmB family TATA-box binding protein n=1 Tax=Senegalia sp. (in: firmicutes) TaxID=1924098 RepID=UPI003F945732
MKGKKLIVYSILIAMIALSNYTVSAELREELTEPTVTAFESIDAELLGINIKAQDQINSEFLNEKSMKELGQDLKDEFKIIGELENENKLELNNDEKLYSMKYIEQDESKKLIISGINNKNKIVRINALTYQDKYSNLNRTELIVNIMSETVDDYKEIKESVQKIFNKYESHPKITSQISGTIDGNINASKKLDIISNITKSVDARIVEEYKNTDILSVSAYSPNIDNHINTGKNKMNLNIAMRNNYTEDKTYIFIATPIIDGGY